MSNPARPAGCRVFRTQRALCLNFTFRSKVFAKLHACRSDPTTNVAPPSFANAGRIKIFRMLRCIREAYRAIVRGGVCRGGTIPLTSMTRPCADRKTAYHREHYALARHCCPIADVYMPEWVNCADTINSMARRLAGFTNRTKRYPLIASNLIFTIVVRRRGGQSWSPQKYRPCAYNAYPYQTQNRPSLNRRACTSTYRRGAYAVHLYQ